jgi:hypothetical protein
MIENCSGCVYQFKRMERFDKGISVPVEGCVRDNDPDICHEFTEKWYAGNDDGFGDSLEEEYLTINEYREFLETKDKLRLAVLRQMLKDIKSG